MKNLRQCKQARIRIQLLIDDELSPSKTDVLNAHLARCEACRLELDKLRALRESLSRLPIHNPGDDFTETVLHRINTMEQRMPLWQRMMSVVLWLAKTRQRIIFAAVMTSAIALLAVVSFLHISFPNHGVIGPNLEPLQKEFKHEQERPATILSNRRRGDELPKVEAPASDSVLPIPAANGYEDQAGYELKSARSEHSTDVERQQQDTFHDALDGPQLRSEESVPSDSAKTADTMLFPLGSQQPRLQGGFQEGAPARRPKSPITGASPSSFPIPGSQPPVESESSAKHKVTGHRTSDMSDDTSDRQLLYRHRDESNASILENGLSEDSELTLQTTVPLAVDLPDNISGTISFRALITVGSNGCVEHTEFDMFEEFPEDVIVNSIRRWHFPIMGERYRVLLSIRHVPGVGWRVLPQREPGDPE